MGSGALLADETSARRRRAFDRLTSTELERAYRLATIILGDPEDARDAVHDACVVAWRAFAELRDHDRFDAWFGRILVNTCRQQLRRRLRVVPAHDLADPAVPAHELVDSSLPDPAERLARVDVLERAVRRLGPDHRMVVALRFFADLTVEEIAGRTGERSGTVKSRLHYALRELRAAYEAVEREGGSRP